MKTKHTKKIIGLSVAAALLIGSSTYAGKIITDASYDNNVTSSQSAELTPNKQFGFGGWNLDNVTVKIVRITDYLTALVGSWFDEVTGEYSSDANPAPGSAMSDGMSFESEIYSTALAGDTAGEIRGRLHGKDWPVGEPSGIKIINDDMAVHAGDPTNCIITTSYLEGYYLSSADPQPTTCSAGYQTHKRFKVNMQPTTVDVADFNLTGGYGKPIDLVFNLDPADTSTAVRRYQVLQKINNYTGVRLDGYKLEVLDENGTKNPNLTLSLENDIDDLANFSNGLWGPIDDHFTTTGFFDDERAYYPMALIDSQTAEWHGDIQGGNYMALFGNWLPSSLAPEGIFYDNDSNPSTDAELVVFLGVAPGSPAGTPLEWHRGYKDNWAVEDNATVAAWLTDPLYAREIIEDTLNLGITYTVNIGENSKIGSTFVIRVTPHVDATSTDSPLPPAPVSSGGGSGGGFDAYDNLSLLAMILGLLGIGAFIARRNLAKQKMQ